MKSTERKIGKAVKDRLLAYVRSRSNGELLHFLDHHADRIEAQYAFDEEGKPHLVLFLGGVDIHVQIW